MLFIIRNNFLNATDEYFIDIFSFDGSTLTQVASTQYAPAFTLSLPSAVKFSPSGNFVAVGGRTTSDSNELQIYSYYGGSLSLVTGYDYSTTGSIHDFSWDPSGNYIAIGGNSPTNGNELQFIKFDGSSALSLVTSQNFGAEINGVAWSPDGKSVAVGGRTFDSGHNHTEIYSVTYRFNSSQQALSNGLVFGNTALGSSSDLDVFLLAGAYVQLNGLLNYDPST